MRLSQSRLYHFLFVNMKVLENGPRKKGNFDFTFLAIPRLPRNGGTWNPPRCRFLEAPYPPSLLLAYRFFQCHYSCITISAMKHFLPTIIASRGYVAIRRG